MRGGLLYKFLPFLCVGGASVELFLSATSCSILTNKQVVSVIAIGVTAPIGVSFRAILSIQDLRYA